MTTAKRVVPRIVVTISFFWLTVRLERVDVPGFPAQKRPRVVQKISLVSPETDGLD